MIKCFNLATIIATSYTCKNFFSSLEIFAKKVKNLALLRQLQVAWWHGVV